MSRSLPILAILSFAFLLASCGSSPAAPSVDPDSIQSASGVEASGATASGAVSGPAGENFDLTSESVATQLRKNGSGAVQVVDRRLFVMNLVRDRLESIDSLFDGIEAISKSVKSAGAELSDTDIAVIVAGVNIEAPQFPMCAQFAARRGSLDPDSTAFAAVDTFCKNRAAAEAATASGQVF